MRGKAPQDVLLGADFTEVESIGVDVKYLVVESLLEAINDKEDRAEASKEFINAKKERQIKINKDRETYEENR